MFNYLFLNAFLAACIAIGINFVTPADLRAHALDPGYLEITELSPETYRVFWRKPDVQQKPMAIEARLPEICEVSAPPAPRFDGAAWISEWTTRCPSGLAGTTIEVPGLEDTRTDVLLRVDLLDSPASTTRLVPEQITFVVPEDTTGLSVLRTYITLGVEHILEGFDHLLFVFALLFLIRDFWRLLGAITAFTAAHSITLALASLGLIHVPAPPVEAVIALSIVFLAVEIAKRTDDAPRLSERAPWVVSFSFGLLHGLGFAGALSDIGLPEGDIFVALLGFNLGVEIGQILFVAAVLVIGWTLKFIVPVGKSSLQVMNTAVSYFVGAVSAFWLVERVIGFWT